MSEKAKTSRLEDSAGKSRASKRRRKDKAKHRASSDGNGLKSPGSGGLTGDDYEDDGSCDEFTPLSNRSRLSLHAKDLSISVGSIGDDDAEYQPMLKILNLNTISDASETYPDKALALLRHLIYPSDHTAFYSNYWKKLPLHLSRLNANYSKETPHFKGFPTKKAIITCLTERALTYGKDITMFSDTGQFEFDDGEIIPSQVLFKGLGEGFGIELKCPQKYFDTIWEYISLLEMEFQSAVDCCTIICPSGWKSYCPSLLISADTFIIQTGGSSSWKLEAPLRSVGSSTQPPSSSVDVVLNAGDTLYIPPDWAFSSSPISLTEESMPIFSILRTNQNTSLISLISTVMSQSLLKISVEEVHPLPAGVMSFMGVAHSESEDERRSQLSASVRAILMRSVSTSVDILDAAVDQVN